MRIFAVGDIHNTCSGENLRVNHPYSTLDAVKYGHTNDEKLAMMVNGILAEHKKKPIDAVLVLGDVGNNDKPFQYYNWVYENEVRGTEKDKWNGCAVKYITEMLLKSPYDCVYDARRCLDKLTEAGIPYFVTTGNHDAYTKKMWQEAYGERAGDFLSPDGTLSYLLEFPKQDTAILMLDTYAYDEDENGDCGPRYREFLRRDNVAYTPISTDPKRREAFLHFIEKAKGYKHFFIAGHYFAGLDVLTGENVNDLAYLRENGNKYGNLRAILYGHSQCFAERTVDGIFDTCVAHWSVAMGDEAITDENGEKKILRFSLPRTPWGYTVLESDEETLSAYRITMPVHYEYDDVLVTHLKRCHPDWKDDLFLMWDEKGYTVSYERTAYHNLYTPNESK